MAAHSFLYQAIQTRWAHRFQRIEVFPLMLMKSGNLNYFSISVVAHDAFSQLACEVTLNYTIGTHHSVKEVHVHIWISLHK